MRFRFDQLDASENAFFSRQLEHIRAQAFEVQYAELKGFQLVPANTSIHPGAEEYTYRVYDKVGRAAFASNDAKGPRVDIQGSESTSKIRTIKDSYGYNLQEVRSAMMANVDLSGRKAKAARDAIATLMDTTILLGDSATGLKGLFNLASTETYTVSTGSGGSQLFTAKTPDEIVQDMLAMIYQVNTNSKGVETCDTLVLPQGRKGLVSTTRMGDGSNQTILSHFLEVNGMVRNVEFSHKLDSNSGWTGMRMVAYKKDPSKLESIIPVEFEQLPPQFDGHEVVTYCAARTGGTVCYFPKSVVYGDNI